MATRAADEPILPEAFLEIDFGPNLKAELDRGVIRMMAGGTYAHSAIQMNIQTFLRTRLRGSGCRPYGFDMAVRTPTWSVRYPDVSIDCAPADVHAHEKALAEPRVVIEILSPSTRRQGLGMKLEDYRSVASIHTVIFVDPEDATIATTCRTGSGWSDMAFSADADLEIAAMDLIVPHAEVFALD